MIFNKILTVLAVFFFVAAGSSSTLAEDQKGQYNMLLGKWDVEAVAQGKIFTFVFTFSMKENNLTGTFESVNRGNADLENIEVVKNKVNFTYSIDLGDEKMTKFEIQATVDKDAMKGELNSAAIGPATFTAKR